MTSSDNKDIRQPPDSFSTSDASQEMCFGLNRATDEESLARLLSIIGDKELVDLLSPRLDDEEISDLVDHIFRLLRRHFSHREYHRFF